MGRNALRGYMMTGMTTAALREFEIDRRMKQLEANSHPPVDLRPIIRELIREELKNKA